MDAWTFTHPGTSTRTESPDWEDGDTDEAFLARLGYRFSNQAYTQEAVPFVGRWQLFVATEAENPCAYAMVVDAPGSEVVLVWLPTFPDVWTSLATYGDIGQSEWAHMALDDIAAT